MSHQIPMPQELCRELELNDQAALQELIRTTVQTLRQEWFPMALPIRIARPEGLSERSVREFKRLLDAHGWSVDTSRVAGDFVIMQAPTVEAPPKDQDR